LSKMVIRVETLSSLMLGSGSGFGQTLDADIVFDSYGLPFFPARRLKGMLRESAAEIAEIFIKAEIADFSADIEVLFGTSVNQGLLQLYDLYPEDYYQTVEWLKWGFAEYPNFINKEAVLETFTHIRYQTAIDDNGIAKETSLRSIRVLNPGIVFYGEIDDTEFTGDSSKLLALACLNLKQAGSRRSRGLGEIRCSLWKNNENYSSHVLTWLRRGATGHVQN